MFPCAWIAVFLVFVFAAWLGFGRWDLGFHCIVRGIMRAMKMDYRTKDLIIFDLDGTLTPSKANMDAAIGKALARLLAVRKVAIVGGGAYAQFRKQVVRHLHASPALLKNLFLFPTVATSFYRYHRGWHPVYEKSFPLREKKKIQKAIVSALATIRAPRPKKTWGPLVDDRHTQITFSALGQKAPLAAKRKWHASSDIRTSLIVRLKKLLPECAVHQGGLTSVDVTEKGIDKAYGIRQMQKHLHIPVRKMLFIGDDLTGHGNDAPVKKTGVQCVSVKGPDETRRVIRDILSAGDK